MLCNDGDAYCNVTTYDWTQPHVREIWVHAVLNALYYPGRQRGGMAKKALAARLATTI